MEDYAIPGLLLMENAARGIAQIATRMCPDGSTVAIVCGPGNNGGDGFAAARHLANFGYRPRLHLAVPPDSLKSGSDPAVNFTIASAMGIPIRETMDVGDAGLVLDAVFGTGLQREVREPFRSVLESIRNAGCPVLAVDLPSGLDADTGAVLGICVRADVTATMVAPKTGFLSGEGPAHIGRVEVVDIGAPAAILAEIAATAP
jgi:NAD(P)H-hydrate epimerase